jgi:transcriptional regulator GlxA family with amidase domain
VASPGSDAFVPTVLVYASRERVRSLARLIFPRKRFRLVFARTPEATLSTFRERLIDAAVIDTGNADAHTWRAAGLSREFPSAPFFALISLRPADAVTVTRCAAAGCADLIVEGVDEPVARQMVSASCFSSRFQRALENPPEQLTLASPLQQRVWRAIISYSGTPVTTEALGRAMGLSREHLSRKFAVGGAPNLKRVIDLVRVIAAAELSKDPGHDLRDVARVLGFASSSHLAVAAGRISGTRPVSLARLRTVDLVDRFCQGRTRSRG